MSMEKTRILLLRIYRSTAVRLILLTFIVYNANLRSITSFDTNATRYLPISILKEFNLDLDEFPFLHKYPDWWFQQYSETGQKVEKSELPYYVQFVRGHYLSTYPIMPAILSVPVYVVPVLLGLTEGSVSAIGFSQTEIVGTFLSKISASSAVAFSVGILYLALLRLTSKRSALWIALIYGLATSSWAVSSQGLWQTAFSQPMLALTFYFLIKARENVRNVIYASFPIAMSVACRPTAIVFAVVLFIYVIHQHRAQIRYFIIFPAIIGVLLLIYNLYYFGTLTGGYASIRPAEFFSYPRWEGLLGLLVSPSRGLLILSPFLIFAWVGLGAALYRRRDPLLTYIAIATVLVLLFYSTWINWPGGFSFSYRHLVDLLPGLSLLLAVIFNWIFTYVWTKRVFLVLVGFSVFIQIIGAFFYPCGWYESPVPANSERQRYWDWRDPEFVRCLCSGPVYPDGLRFFRTMNQKR